MKLTYSNLLLSTLLLVAIFTLGSCKKKFQKIDENFYLKRAMKGDAEKGPEAGEMVRIRFNITDEQSNVFFPQDGTTIDTYLSCNPMVWNTSGPIYKTMMYLKEGDSIISKTTLKELFYNGWSMPVPDTLDPAAFAFINMGMPEVMSDSLYQIKMEADRKQAMADELETIRQYAADNNLDIITTESGLSIAISEQGTGPKPESGESVTVHYTGMLLDGKVFDTSLKGENKPFNFTIGQGQVIKGWDEGIAALNIGSKATLLIPSSLGYGARGAGGAIPPNAILKFEVELLGSKSL